MQSGDLVRWNPHRLRNERIMPLNKLPLGIVMSITNVTVGEDPRQSAIMETVQVFWFDSPWEASSGVTDENRQDLEVVQTLVK